MGGWGQRRFRALYLLGVGPVGLTVLGGRFRALYLLGVGVVGALGGVGLGEGAQRERGAA